MWTKKDSTPTIRICVCICSVNVRGLFTNVSIRDQLEVKFRTDWFVLMNISASIRPCVNSKWVNARCSLTPNPVLIYLGLGRITRAPSHAHFRALFRTPIDPQFVFGMDRRSSLRSSRSHRSELQVKGHSCFKPKRPSCFSPLFL